MIKLFEQYVNENLFEERMCETYFCLRIMHPDREEAVTDFVLKEFTMDADSLGESLERWLDDHDFKGNADGFVAKHPSWFNDFLIDPPKEVVKFNHP